MAPLSERSDATGNARHLVSARVVDAGGNQASVVSIENEGADEKAWVRIADGTQVLVPVSLFAEKEEGVYRLPFTFHVSGAAQTAQMTFPVMEEEMDVATRVIDTGKGIRVHKTVSEREEVVNQPLLREEIAVEHVTVGRDISDSELPQVRYEGQTMIVPVLEEVLVVQKRLMLKEELHITRQRREVQETQSVLLRSEQISVERFDEGQPRTDQ